MYPREGGAHKSNHSQSGPSYLAHRGCLSPTDMQTANLPYLWEAHFLYLHCSLTRMGRPRGRGSVCMCAVWPRDPSQRYCVCVI